MKIRKSMCVSLVAASLALSGCANNGEEYAADVYDTTQLNQKQKTKTVNLLAIVPAKVKVDNVQNKQAAQTAGSILGAVAGGIVGYNVGGRGILGTGAGLATGGVAGAVAGGMVKDKVIVEGVTLSYKDGTELLSSTQVGKKCQFKTGLAVMITNEATNETRIQPNAECPVEDKKKK